MSLKPWFAFYPANWRGDPALRMCSISARGLWMEMLCIMHEADPRGSLLVNGHQVSGKQLASLSGLSLNDTVKLLGELAGAGVFSREDNGTIYSRRMKRDEEKALRDKANGKTGGHPEIKRGTVQKDQRVRRFRRSDAPAKARRIFDRSSGDCNWCHKQLDPEHYHIDHVIAVRDGGTNDENNLVASCPECNGERAMTWGRNDADLMVGNKTDHKAHIPEVREQKEDSEASASALTGDVEILDEDPKAKLFRLGKTILISFGIAEKRTGALIGQWLKSRNDPDGLLAAIQFARDQNVAEPVAYISAVISERKTNGKLNLGDLASELADQLRERERAAGFGRSAVA